jgi:RHS repeat-associated protein
VTTSSVTGTTPVDIKASFGGVDQHAVLTVVSFAVQGKAPLEPRWAGVGSPLLMASLAPWRESSAEYFWSPSSSGGLNLRPSDGDSAEKELEPDQARSIQAATFPGPPKRNFLYSPETSLLAESELSTPRDQKILYEYIWFNGHPVAQIDGQAVTHWTFTDHLGTPLIQTTASQAVWWRAEYEPYGRVWAYNPTGLADQHQPLRLPGQEAEQFNLGSNGFTERSYNVFRWYRSAWGRYAQADPILVSGKITTIDAYRYARANPTIFTDRLGLVAWSCSYNLTSAQFIAGPSFGAFFARCTSECACRKSLTVEISGALGGAAVGLPAGSASSTITLRDGSPCPDSSNLAGPIGLASAGGGLGVGLSYTVLSLGSATGRSDFTVRGMTTYGIDFGAGVLAGAGGVMYSSSSSCCGSTR